MPYVRAYVLWMAFSVVLYLAGLFLITNRFFRGDPFSRPLIFCFALAYYPFIVGTLINGQLVAVGFFALALAIHQDDRERPLASGLALSLCAYKPTLLVLILPMLLVTRRVRTLVGFGIGALALVLFATTVEGVQVWSGYLETLRYFNGMHSTLRLPIYIDFRAFTSLLSPQHSWITLALVSAFAAWSIVCLFRLWVISVNAGNAGRTLVWATTITWTLLLNIYVPMYDSILLVISIIVSARVLKNFSSRWFGILCTLTFGSAWVTVEIAERTGIQVLTILLAALGSLQLFACKREIEISAHRGWLQNTGTQPEEAGLSSRREGVSAFARTQSH
jgi:hypothetical protein